MIYLVISSFGEYDERYTTIDSAWATQKGAEARIVKIEDEMKRIRSITSPKFRDELPTNEEWSKYEKWSEKTWEAREYNNSWVQKMKVQ